MAKNRATHRGTCQVCGATQKLPNNALSCHGYTTRWGFFSGVCPGSYHHPFETHTDLIEKAIADATARAADLRAQAAAEDVSTDPNVVVQLYISGYRRGAGYAWVPCTVVEADDPRWHRLVRQDGRPEGVQHRTHPGGVEDAARDFHRDRARGLRHEASQLAQYAEWQTQRITGWTPQPLTPVG